MSKNGGLMKKAQKNLIIFVNIIFIIIDILVLLGFIFLCVNAVIYLLSIIGLELKLGNLTSCLFGSSKDVITNFGVFASVTIIPLFSFILSLMSEKRKNDNRISEALASATSIGLYLAKLPLGIWNGLINSYYSYSMKYPNHPLYPLLDYRSCLYLIFEGEVFQSYEINTINLSIKESSTSESLLGEKAIAYSTDTTGISNGLFANGTNIFVLDKQENMFDRFFKSEFNGKTQNLIYELDIKSRDERGKKIWASMFKDDLVCPTLFPIIKSIFYCLLNKINKYTLYRLEILTNNQLEPITENETKFQIPILDLDIKIIKKSKLKKFNKKTIDNNLSTYDYN